MHIGTFVFAQIVQILPQRQFRRILAKYSDRTKGWSMSHWNHLLVLMFGQLMGCGSLRELTDFEEFAFYMVSIAQTRRITKEFELHGKFYAIDSTTIDLCKSVFRWAEFRSTKSGIRIHTQIDIVTEIPVFYRITNAKVHDVNSMDWFTYEPLACYVFDRGYFDLARLYRIHAFGAFFIIREKGKPAYEIIDGESILEGTDNVLKDQSIRFTRKENQEKYPGVIRRIVYYAPELQRSFVYYTNNFYLADSGESPRMRSAYRFTLQSSHTVSLPSSSTTSRLADPSLKSCVSLVSLHSPQTASKTCSSLSDKRQRRQMTDSFILTSNLINIY